MITNWGYDITDADQFADMMSLDEFDEFTAGKYQSDDRVYLDIKAASNAIRNYCGWHVYPSQECRLSTTMWGSMVTRVGRSVDIQLPAKYVTDVSSVSINGTEYTQFIFEPNGMLKVFGVPYVREYATVEVEYTAGLPDGLMDGIRELVAHRVTHALASSDGVQSETAGGVSITYSTNWTNSARATALTDDNKEVLAPYKVQGVF